MSEWLYRLLLRSYPKHFRAAYTEEALQLFRDRLQAETGVPRKVQFWCDILLDYARSMPWQHLSPAHTQTALASTNKRAAMFGTLEGDAPGPRAICAAVVLAPLLLLGVVLLNTIGHLHAKRSGTANPAEIALARYYAQTAGGLLPEAAEEQLARDSIHAVVQRIALLVDQKYDDPQGSQRIAAALAQSERSGAFGRTKTLLEFADAVTQTMRTASHDPGFQVFYDPFISASGKSSIHSAQPVSDQLSLIIPPAPIRK